MSEVKRKVFSAEFKAKVGLEAIHGVKTINQIVQDHGCILCKWDSGRKRYWNALAACLKASAAPKAVNEYSEPELLYGEIGKLKMELDWLKKSPEHERH